MELDGTLRGEEEEEEEEEGGKKYDFDFHALSNLKRREKLKVFVLAILIALLVIILLVVCILYHKELNKNRVTSFIPRATPDSAQTKAYKQISKYGEDCSSTSKHHIECGANAYCRYLQGTYRCDCKQGFVGDGIGDCKDVNFAIQFKTITTKNIPEIKRLEFPKTDALSFCLWFNIAEFDTKWHALFMYTSVDIPGSNELMLWVTHKHEIQVSMREADQLVWRSGILPSKKWTHLCWTWNNTGRWSLYISGKKENTGRDPLKRSFIGTFPESQGSLILGQDKDNDRINESRQMFRGEISQLYIYNKQITDDEVYSAFQNHPLTQNVVAGWWQFKNTTKGTDIVESKFPKDLLMTGV